MFDIGRQEQRISELKARIQGERQSAREQLRVLVPQTRRAMVWGSAAWGARKALPLLQPLALWLLRRNAAKAGAGYLLKFSALAGLAVGAWRLLRPEKSSDS